MNNNYNNNNNNNNNNKNNNNNMYDDLRELFYDRNPGDARVKVGSDWEFASSPARPSRGVAEILGFLLRLSYVLRAAR